MGMREVMAGRISSNPYIIRRAIREETDPWILALYQKRLGAIENGTGNDANLYELAWEVLVKYAGAYENPRHDNRERARFLSACLDESYSFHNAFEYRFGGELGFGGKFWRQDGSLFVTCYYEDETPGRLAIKNRVNDILKVLTK
jgi:hypothetical protein